MRTSQFEDFETEGLLSGTQQRSWLWFGLFVSLILHLALCAYFYRTRFIPFDAKPRSEQTAMFKVRNVDLNPQLDKNSMDQTNPAAKPEPDNPRISNLTRRNLLINFCRTFRPAPPSRMKSTMCWTNRRRRMRRR